MREGSECVTAYDKSFHSRTAIKKSLFQFFYVVFVFVNFFFFLGPTRTAGDFCMCPRRSTVEV